MSSTPTQALTSAAAGSGPDIGIPYKGRRSITAEDSAMQAAAQPWIGLECYQLSRGKQLAQIEALDLGHQQVVRERQHAAVQKLGVTPANVCTVSYCTPDPAFRFSGHAATSTAPVFFMPGNTAFDLYIPTGAQTGYVSFSEAEFISGAQALNPRVWDCPPSQVTQFRSHQQNDLAQALDLWLAATDEAALRGERLDPGKVRNIILQTTLQIVTDSCRSDTLPPNSARTRAVRIFRKARDYVQDCFNAQMVPTIVDVCLSVGVSERTLQYAFQDCVGMSPLAYIRRCRLNRVRSALLTADAKDTSVTLIAMQFGFLHLGRFAGEYKQIFEESPSTTLSRCA